MSRPWSATSRTLPPSFTLWLKQGPLLLPAPPAWIYSSCATSAATRSRALSNRRGFLISAESDYPRVQATPASPRQRQHCGDSQDYYGDIHLPIQSFRLDSFNVLVAKH